MDLNDMNSYAKLNAQITKVLNPFSTVHDYTVGSGISEYRKLQEQMALALKPISTSTSLFQEYANFIAETNERMSKLLQPFSSLGDYSSNLGSSLSEFIKMQEDRRVGTLKSVFSSTSSLEEYANSITEANERIAKLLNPFSSLQDYTMNIGSNISELIKIQSQSESMTSLLNSIGSVYETMSRSTYLDSLNDTLEKLDFSSLSTTEKVEKDFEAQIEFLLPENKKAFDDIMVALIKIFPEIKNIQDAYKSKKYVQLLTYGIVYIFVIMLFFNQLYSLVLTPIPLYKINRDNVRIRTEPSTKNSLSIITKLNKNIVVVKIDSQKNWVKIEFENNQGEISEGWVRNDMLTKIEQQ